jgi:signal transduction histidine kinase
LRATREGDHAVVCVRDNGAGISPSAMPHIFEMFNRGDRDSNRNQAGLGIGLALSRQLANLHWRHARSQQRGHGHGQRFHLARAPVRFAGTGSPGTSIPR